jgi:hypothetical protein
VAAVVAVMVQRPRLRLEAQAAQAPRMLEVLAVRRVLAAAAVEVAVVALGALSEAQAVCTAALAVVVVTVPPQLVTAAMAHKALSLLRTLRVRDPAACLWCFDNDKKSEDRRRLKRHMAQLHKPRRLGGQCHVDLRLYR